MMNVADVIPASLVRQALDAGDSALTPLDEARRAFERDYLARILKITAGNVTQAAAVHLFPDAAACRRRGDSGLNGAGMRSLLLLIIFFALAEPAAACRRFSIWHYNFPQPV